MDITLALGGGGARGNAHIGVLRRLEKERFKIRAIAGTSFGGIVAALYAAGLSPDEIEQNFLKVDQARLYRRSSRHQPSLFNLEGVETILERWIGKKTFDQLRIPCALTAVDLQSVKEVILQDGSVVEAVLATIALPGVFPPRLVHDHQLVDGGVMDPVPVIAARSLAPNLPVVAVVLTPRVEQSAQSMRLPMPVPIPAPIVRRLTRTRIAQAFAIFIQGVDIGGRVLAELRLRVDKPEVIIRPRVHEIGLLDRVDVQSAARLGEDAVREILPAIRRAVSWPNRMHRILTRRQGD